MLRVIALTLCLLAVGIAGSAEGEKPISNIKLTSDEDIVDLKKLVGGERVKIPTGLLGAGLSFGTIAAELHFTTDDQAIYFRTITCKEKYCNEQEEGHYLYDLKSKETRKLDGQPADYDSFIKETHSQPPGLLYVQAVGTEDTKYTIKMTVAYDVTVNKVPISRGQANRAFWRTFEDVWRGKYAWLDDRTTLITTFTNNGLYGLFQHPIRLVNTKTGKVANIDEKAGVLCVSHDGKLLAYTKMHSTMFHIHLAKIEAQ